MTGPTVRQTNMEKEKIKKALESAAKSMWMSFPVLLGAILLVSLSNALIPRQVMVNFFGTIPFVDSLIGAGIGSILAGNPVTSYIIGGELLGQGVSLAAVTAFIVAWVTVGIVQLPAESILLGKRFAIVRNIVSFVFAVITAHATVMVMGILGP